MLRIISLHYYFKEYYIYNGNGIIERKKRNLTRIDSIQRLCNILRTIK